MTRVDRLIAYPVKSMDGADRKRARLSADAPLAGDRSYAVLEADADPETASVGGGGGYVNGKSERRVHEVRASYDLPQPAEATPASVTLATRDRGPRTFDLPGETEAMAAWLGEHYGYPVRVIRDDGGFPDDASARGPTVVSRATLAEVASWYDGVDANEMCRRLRPNVVLADCPAFWEDRLFADRASRVRFRVGDAGLLGVNPCQRCVVPSRDPDTGAETPGFRETFLERRRATMPEWSGGDWFDHDFRLMVNTETPAEAAGAEIAVGDEVEVLETVSVPESA
ncbi:MOSC domain-containing protein [Haloparvum sedimenti]|uniref:MOSC domain-containing protein n=1 Tax=Haloparvum sedimenti TaxID=1678448 RepID=UPI00071E6F24|nr:MOSC N-terminal beta barrel domain-containing protein [Haloparvum sedimenti]